MIVPEDIPLIIFFFTLFLFLVGCKSAIGRMSAYFFFIPLATLVDGLEMKGLYKSTTKRLHFVFGLM
jgi:hypothetical protein